MGQSRIYNGRTKTQPFEGYGGRIVQRALHHDAATKWASSKLPERFVSTIGFASGWWSAPLPEDIPDDIANIFNNGILPEPPRSEWRPFDAKNISSEMAVRVATSFGCTQSDLVVVPKASLVLFAAQWAVDYLSSATSSLALVREMHSKPDNSAVIWESAMGTFYPIAGARWDRENVADLMDRAGIVNEEFMMLTSSDKLDASRKQTLLDTDLVDLIARANTVILSAYDGEGYIRWSRATAV